MTQLVQHLKELRQRFLRITIVLGAAFSLCYFYKEPLFHFLMAPLIQNGTHKLIFTSLPELFFTYVKLAFYAGFFITLPVFLWQLWRFVAPGLYKNERHSVQPFLIATPLLAYMGGIFTYYVILPLVVPFFLGFQSEKFVALLAVKDYLSFVVKMMFAFALAFNLPVFILLLVKAGIVSPKKLSQGRRYVLVVIFIAAAILTPPDPASQMLLAFPLWFLYEIAAILSRFVYKDTEKQADEASA